MSSTFGTLLRRHRIEANLSQEALAETARVSPSAIGAYERGVHAAPHRYTVALLADALDLQGNTRAEFELAARRKPRAAKTASSAGEPGLTFPPQTTSFVGREDDVSRVEDQLRRARCVTVTGTGGIGKTRLAVQVAARSSARFRDGSVFVDLGSATGDAIVLSKVALALGVSPQSSDPELADFAASVRDRALLLVLDNCEHVLIAAGGIAAAIVRGAPNITVLATSRERLRISAEVVYRLASLPVEAGSQLFMDRVTALDPAMRFTGAGVALVSEICQTVDGIPLALELAAARVPSLGLKALLEQLRSRLSVLDAGSHDMPTRQRTLDATLAWSFELLDDVERSVLQRISTFSGGWTLPAAQAVCGNERLSADAVCDALSSLVEKCLVAVDLDADVVRYRLLHVTRIFAAAKARDAGDAPNGARRHADWFVALAEREAAASVAPARRAGHTVPDTLANAELDNLRTAADWALHAGDDALAAAKILSAFYGVWSLRGLLVEFRRLGLATVDRLSDAEHPRLVAHLFWCVSNCARGAEAIAAGERAMELFERIGDTYWLARSLSSLAWALQMAGRLADAVAALERAATLYRQDGLGSTIRFAELLLMRGTLAIRSGDMDDAHALYTEALGIGFLGAGEGKFTIGCRVNLAELEFVRGNHEAAVAAALTALEKAREFNLRHLELILLANLAGYRLALGDLNAAGKDACTVLAQTWDGDHALANTALRIVATVVGRLGDATSAARLSGLVLANNTRLGLAFDPTERVGFESLLTTLRNQLADDELARLQDDGARLERDDALRIALTAGGA